MQLIVVEEIGEGEENEQLWENSKVKMCFYSEKRADPVEVFNL